MEKVFYAANKNPDVSALLWVRFAGRGVLITAGHRPLFPDVFFQMDAEAFPDQTAQSASSASLQNLDIAQSPPQLLWTSKFRTSSRGQLMSKSRMCSGLVHARYALFNTSDKHSSAQMLPLKPPLWNSSTVMIF